jgi:hypothetical protein
MDLIKAHLLRNQLCASLKSLPYYINSSKSEVCLITCKLAYTKIDFILHSENCQCPL